MFEIQINNLKKLVLDLEIQRDILDLKEMGLEGQEIEGYLDFFCEKLLKNIKYEGLN